jgi:hypothetical protein
MKRPTGAQWAGQSIRFILSGSGPSMKFDGQLEGTEISRRAARTDVAVDVLIRCAAGEFKAEIVNLSARGFRIKTSKSLEPGWEVTLTAGKLAPVGGIVRWVAGVEAGGNFTEPVIL